jgi:hypothetical protein
MADKSEQSKQLITIHQKAVDNTLRIIDETKDLISRLKINLEDYEKLLDKQRKELDALLKDAKTK